VVIAANGQMGDFQPHSKWDENLLNIELHNVRVKADSMPAAWQEIRTKYLLRANFYRDGVSNEDSAKFTFSKEVATEGELLEAFLATYPDYTYTQDKETGILWIHQKRVNYDDILSQKVRIERPAYQVTMLTGVFTPLCRLFPNVHAFLFEFGPPMNLTFDYGIDLPAGNCTVREILNYCCIRNLTMSFAIARDAEGQFFIKPIDSYYGNPLAPPRAAAVKFWEIEIGKSTNGIPNIAEISTAMSDTNPRKRWAARSYLEAAWKNYRFSDLSTNSDSPEKAVWAALGIQDVIFRGINDSEYNRDGTPGFTNNLAQIKDPGLALLASLELTREKQGTSYLDAIVSKHKFSEAEIASIKPDVYRLAHKSKLVLDKLKTMKLNVPEFSAEALSELERTNLFTLIPMGKN
jgi:hypothetical protein